MRWKYFHSSDLYLAGIGSDGPNVVHVPWRNMQAFLALLTPRTSAILTSSRPRVGHHHDHKQRPFK